MAWAGIFQPHGDPYQSGEKYLLTYHGGGATITESVQAAGWRSCGIRGEIVWRERGNLSEIIPGMCVKGKMIW